MRISLRKGSWILFFIFFMGIIAPSLISASPTPGLSVTVYNYLGYNSSPPLPSETNIAAIGTTNVGRVQQSFDSEPLFNLYEDFIVKYEGNITSPVSGPVVFYPSADDGTKLIIDNNLIDDNWYDKGCCGGISQEVLFTAGESKPFTLWFYENGGGAWVELYWNIGNGWEIVPDSAFTQSPVVPVTTTTTIQKFLGKPKNVVLTDTGNGIKVDWDAADDNVEISVERYSISWSTNNGGWGVATGNVGDPNATDTEIVLDYSLFSSTGGLRSEYSISVRADNDTYAIYSNESDPTYLKIGTTPTPPTTTTTTTTTTLPPSTTTTQPEVVSTTTTISPSTTLQQSTTTTEPTKILSTTTTTTTSTTTSTTTTTPSTTTTTTPKNIDVNEEINNVLQNPNVDSALSLILTGDLNKDQIKEVVDAIIEQEITAEDAQELATNSEVLNNIDSEQASEIFSSIKTSELNNEEKSQITESVQAAPEEVRNAFENEINIYADGFDDYVPVGSSIDVGSRRTLLAATTVFAGATALAAASGGSGSSPGGSGPRQGGQPTGGSSGGPGSGSAGDQNNTARKEKEEEGSEEEEAPEIEGPDGEEEESNFTRNSIFKYTEGTMEKRFSPVGFIKKFARETAALAFTISGSVIVFATLSGETRKITIIATSVAFAVHYINAMIKNDN